MLNWYVGRHISMRINQSHGNSSRPKILCQKIRQTDLQKRIDVELFGTNEFLRVICVIDNDGFAESGFCFG